MYNIDILYFNCKHASRLVRLVKRLTSNGFNYELLLVVFEFR